MPVRGRVGGPFDVTVADGMIASVRPSGSGGIAGHLSYSEIVGPAVIADGDRF